MYELQDTSITSSNNIDNYQTNPKSFDLSEDCRVEASGITLKKISGTNVTNDQIRAYHFNHDRVFVLADNSISYYALSTDQPTSNPQLTMVGQIPNISSAYNLDAYDSRFFSMNKSTFVVDTESLFLINIKQQGPTTSLSLTKVLGYNPLSEFGEIERVVAKSDNTFVVLSNEAVTEYICPKHSSCNKRDVVTSLKESKHNFVDVGYINGDIFLLDESEGIFVQRSGVTDGTL